MTRGGWVMESISKRIIAMSSFSSSLPSHTTLLFSLFFRHLEFDGKVGGGEEAAETFDRIETELAHMPRHL